MSAAPRARRLVVSTVSALALVAAVLVWPVRDRVALALLERLPSDPRCGSSVGRVAALAQGSAVEPCEGALAADAWSGVLARIARERGRSDAARMQAFAHLVETGRAPAGLAEALLATPPASPTLRRGVADALAGDVAWLERARDIGIHGLYDIATARLFALGEPWTAAEVAAALDASAADEPRVLAAVYEGLGTTRAALTEASRRQAAGQLPLAFPTDTWDAFWHHRCDERDPCLALLGELLTVEAKRHGEPTDEPAAPLPVLDAAIEDLTVGEGARGDHLRRELAVVAGWIGRVPANRRAARLVAAVVHDGAVAPTPEEALSEAGDPHAVLHRGGGAPGATAFTAHVLGALTGVPVSVWATPDGVGIQAGGHLVTVEGCGPPTAISGGVPGGWREVPASGVEALALVEAAGRALRAGDYPSAQARVEAARRAWDAAPGLDGMAAAVMAVRPAEKGADAGMAPDTLFVSRPVMAKRHVEPDPRPGARASRMARADAIRALTPGHAEHVRAAWWAAVGGDADLARVLLATLPDAPAVADLRAATALRIGEPAGPAGPLSAAVAGKTWPTGRTCPRAFSAEPAVPGLRPPAP